ncbi:MAG: AAA family ATPase [Clostridia bacterium]|nr:AAA family ATPase [Clostridia bacterium]
MIIGISGGSGAGKSTTSRKLAEVLPNSLLVVVDISMHEYSSKYEKEILKKIGISENPDLFCYNYFHDSFENIKTWIDTIKSDVISDVEKIINDNPGKDYIIVDWCYLPLCKFNEKCDYTICVKSDFDERKGRLTKRLLNIQNSSHDKYNIPFSKWTTEAYEKRLKYSDLSEQGYSFDYYLYNNSSLADLNNNIEMLAQNIKNLTIHNKEG